jgi:hypothetical protein
MEAAPHPWPALGVLLVREGLVSREDLNAILEEQRAARHQRVSGRQLGQILVEREMVTPKQVARLIAEQYELLFVDLETSDIDVRIASVLDRELAERLSAIPIHLRVDGSYLVAIADPATVLFSDELRGALGSSPHFAVVGPEAIASAIAFVHDQPHGLPDTVEDPEDDRERDPCVVLEFPGDESDGSTVFENTFGARATVLQRSPLGALLLRDGLVSEQDLEEALARRRSRPAGGWARYSSIVTSLPPRPLLASSRSNTSSRTSTSPNRHRYRAGSPPDRRRAEVPSDPSLGAR